MNALRILLIICFVIYFLYSDRYYLYFFLGTVFTYYLLIELLITKNVIKSSKYNFFISMWSSPNDPSIYMNQKVDLTEVYSKLKKYSDKFGIKIGISALLVKLKGLILKEFSLINTVIVLGKIIPRNNCNVSLLTSFGDESYSDVITISDCDKKSVIEIQKEIKNTYLSINSKDNKDHNSKMFWCNFIPS